MENFAIMVPGLIALGEILKRVFGVRSKMVPVSLLVVGVVVGFSLEGITSLSALGSFVAVATALGLYSGAKATAEAFSVGQRSIVSRKKK